ncbi:MAG: FAD-dependent oxidoreductase [Candidatus Marinimicrobia bacterium]|nr:FAD-dependent oxidoreductase [Candidatus Neomarinimicrobiota bacterium]
MLQTHKFFGSTEDCYAGTRGLDIAGLLGEKVRRHPGIRVMNNTMIAGIYKDRKAGAFVNNRTYKIIDFKGLLVASGARERSLLFPGNPLPGIYGAGAFQTLVNRDGIKAADRLFIVGSGNVGLIAAYHALQAGIRVKGICDILPRPGGYKVHADKIRRMGVPLYQRHTILHAGGTEKLERVTIAGVDAGQRPLLDTAKTFEVDTLLIAVGLAPVDENYDTAASFGFPVVKTGDADEIAEASSAMFGGRIAGLNMAKRLGRNIRIDPSFHEKAEILKNPPGKTFPKQKTVLDERFRPVIHCVQEIPCNPCETVCPVHAIRLKKRRGNILDVPEYTGGCTGCMKCVAVCPGLAISLARRIGETKAEVVLPYEFIPDFTKGDRLDLMDMEGNFLEKGTVKKLRYYKPFRTSLVTLEVSLGNAPDIAGIRVQPEAETRPSKTISFEYLPEDAILCRCEMITVKQVRDFIREHHVRDMNQLKALRVGMGSCGGKNCSLLLPRIFRELNIPPEAIVENTRRPLSVEIPMHVLANEKHRDSGEG